MVRVEFLGPINKKALEIEAKDLNDVAGALQNDEEVKDWLETCAVAINDTMVYDRDITLNDGDRVSLLPPVCGG